MTLVVADASVALKWFFRTRSDDAVYRRALARGEGNIVRLADLMSGGPQPLRHIKTSLARTCPR